MGSEATPAQFLREALIASSAGQHDNALAAVDQALRLGPGDARILIERAAILRVLGRLGEAREAAHKATVLAPTMPEAFAALGLAFFDQRKIAEAEGSFKRALQFNLRCPEALAGRARLRLSQKRHAEAEAMLANAIRVRPSESRLYMLLGDVFADRSNQVGMVEAYRRARDLDPFNTEALEKYAMAREQVGGPDAARLALEEAVARQPESAIAHRLLAKFLSDHGSLDQAASSARRAVEIDPSSALAINLLAGAKKFTSLDDPDFLSIKTARDNSKPGSKARAVLAFSLGKALDDLKLYGEAFDAYLEGNTLRHSEVSFSIESERRAVEAIEKAFGTEWIARLKGAGHPSSAPIFIVGMPRSGTTLTETILSRHRDVYAAGELEFMKMAATGIVGASPTTDARRFADRLKPRQLQQIGDTYLGQLDSRAQASTRFTDKMPHNFQLLGLINLAFPNAKVVHVRRDPLDNCLSMFKANFGADGMVFTSDLTELGQYYNLYRRLMRHWRSALPMSFFEIDYEALVSDPEASTRALFAYCGLDWTADVLRVEQSRNEVRTASFAQVRQPIHRGSVSAAERYGARLDPLRRALEDTASDGGAHASTPP